MQQDLLLRHHDGLSLGHARTGQAFDEALGIEGGDVCLTDWRTVSRDTRPCR